MSAGGDNEETARIADRVYGEHAEQLGSLFGQWPAWASPHITAAHDRALALSAVRREEAERASRIARMEEVQAWLAKYAKSQPAATDAIATDPPPTPATSAPTTPATSAPTTPGNTNTTRSKHKRAGTDATSNASPKDKTTRRRSKKNKGGNDKEDEAARALMVSLHCRAMLSSDVFAVRSLRRYGPQTGALRRATGAEAVHPVRRPEEGLLQKGGALRRLAPPSARGGR